MFKKSPTIYKKSEIVIVKLLYYNMYKSFKLFFKLLFEATFYYLVITCKFGFCICMPLCFS